MRGANGLKVMKVFSLVLGVIGVGATGMGAFPFFFKSEKPNLRISDFPSGRVQAGTLSAGQRGLSVGQSEMVVAVWSDTREGRSNIYLARSGDGGRNFESNILVNDTPGTAGLFGATVALDQHHRAHVVWFDERNGDSDIFFARESDSGQGLTMNVRVNDDKNGKAGEEEFVPDEFFDQPAGVTDGSFQTLPSIVIDRRGTIYVTWQDYRRNQADIYFSRSTDSGRTFSPNVRVNDEVGRAGQLYPSLGVDKSGTIYVAWHDFRRGEQDVFFSKSLDGGNTFSKNLRINDDLGTAGQFNPSLAVDDTGAVHVAWHDLRNGDADIYYTLSQDGGLTFSRNIRVNDDQGEAFQFHPSLGINGQGEVGVVWEDYRNGHADIYFAKKMAKGSSFGKTIRVNEDERSVDHLHASLAGTQGTAFVVIWEDQRNEPENRPSPCRPVHCSDIYFAGDVN